MVGHRTLAAPCGSSAPYSGAERALTMSQDDLLAKANRPGQDALRLHPFYKGKVQVLPRCAVQTFEDFAVWYTPGVAAPCRAIQADPALVYEHTNKGNSIAIVTDGTRILGLGDIGPQAGLPVMEGKALLYKFLGGVDAVCICLGTKDADVLIRTVELLEPAFGGINLEDIAQPKCFRILDTLRATMHIPVWHDDQQGTATVALAGLLNALKVVGKSIQKVKIALIGMGAANVPTYRLLKGSGIDPQAVIACDTEGTLHRGRADVERQQAAYAAKWQVCLETNPERVGGGIADALRGSDVCIAFSAPGPNRIKPEWIRTMAKDPIVFACANPVPEIWPWEAHAAGARIVATGRSDFPNQLNNSLVFPGIFRGALDVRARTISDGMATAAAHELAACAEEAGLREDRILPRMDEWEVFPREAVAAALAAQQEGLAQLALTREQLHDRAVRTIGNAREATRLLLDHGLIPRHD
jgi:malate dehydrogenase (oxaloacetate-decarboxylating)